MPRSTPAWRARGAHEVGQPGELALGAQHEPVGGLVGEHVLAELRRQLGEPPHDLGVALLFVGAEARAGAREVGVIALEHAQLLGAEAELGAPLVQRVDSREQRGVHRDRAVVRGEARRHLRLDRLQRRRRLARRQVEEQLLQPRDHPAGAVERGDRVRECRRCRIGADRIDLGPVLGDRRVERRLEVLGPHGAERRQAVRRVPALQQRVVGLVAVRCRCRHHLPLRIMISSFSS